MEFENVVSKNTYLYNCECSKLAWYKNDLLSEENIAPIVLAWVWNDYRSKLPQTQSEAEELMKLPTPTA